MSTPWARIFAMAATVVTPASSTVSGCAWQQPNWGRRSFAGESMPLHLGNEADRDRVAAPRAWSVAASSKSRKLVPPVVDRPRLQAEAGVRSVPKHDPGFAVRTLPRIVRCRGMITPDIR